ncbi:hypothetical protein B6J57_02295, partial [Klebsiella pneumoniae]
MTCKATLNSGQTQACLTFLNRRRFGDKVCIHTHSPMREIASLFGLFLPLSRFYSREGANK